MKLNKTIAAFGLGAVLSMGCTLVASAQANQPHMQNALGDLQAAKGELQVALRDKGGHRAYALGLVNQAITQVQAGIAAGDGY